TACWPAPIWPPAWWPWRWASSSPSRCWSSTAGRAPAGSRVTAPTRTATRTSDRGRSDPDGAARARGRPERNTGGVTIHYTDPFATPEPARSRSRRLRGRTPAPVTVWTAYGPDGRPAGLTVSSTVVADGDPGAILGLVDEESDLYAAATASGRFLVMVLREG